MGLPRLDGEGLVHDGTERDLVTKAAVSSRNRDCATPATGERCLTQDNGPVGFQHGGLLHTVVGILKPMTVRLHTDGIDTRVWPAPACHLRERFKHIYLFIVN